MGILHSLDHVLFLSWVKRQITKKKNPRIPWFGAIVSENTENENETGLFSITDDFSKLWPFPVNVG